MHNPARAIWTERAQPAPQLSAVQAVQPVGEEMIETGHVSLKHAALQTDNHLQFYASSALDVTRLHRAMNYRHAYHAGNFADVVKHATLALLIERLRDKESPFCVLDTHAGIGRYDLSSVEAQKTGEFRDGVLRLLD